MSDTCTAYRSVMPETKIGQRMQGRIGVIDSSQIKLNRIDELPLVIGQLILLPVTPGQFLVNWAQTVQNLSDHIAPLYFKPGFARCGEELAMGQVFDSL